MKICKCMAVCVCSESQFITQREYETLIVANSACMHTKCYLFPMALARDDLKLSLNIKLEVPIR